MPATTSIEDIDTVRRLARSLAAAGGVELSPDRPAVAVDLEHSADGTTRSHRCSVSLPSAEGTAHISITSDRETPPSPIDLVTREVLAVETVAAIWTVAANQRIVVFVGPAQSEPAVALSANVPFILPSVWPVSLAATNRPISLPQETGITLQGPTASSTGPTGLENRASLDSDMLVLSDIERPATMRRFGTAVAAGRGVLAAARTADRRFFAHVALEAGLSPGALGAIDLLVELPETASPERVWTPVTHRGGARSESDGAPDHSDDRGVRWTHLDGGDSETDEGSEAGGVPDEEISDLVGELAKGLKATGTAAEVAANLTRRRRYVEYLRTEGMTGRSKHGCPAGRLMPRG